MRDPNVQPQGPTADLSLHYDKWINAYQTEIWESVSPAAAQVARLQGARSDRPLRADHQRVRVQGADPRTSSGCAALELSFRENDVDLPFGYRINNPQCDNNYMRNHQVPNTQDPSSRREHGQRRLLPHRLPARLLLREHRRRGAGALSQRHDGAGQSRGARRQHHRDAVGPAARVRQLGGVLPQGDDSAGHDRGHAPAHRHRGAVLHRRGRGHRLHGRRRRPSRTRSTPWSSVELYGLGRRSGAARSR